MPNDNDASDHASYSRYVFAEFAKGMYAVACMAVDVFLVLQLHVSYHSLYAAILSVMIVIVLTGFELWFYNRFKKRLARNDSHWLLKK